jgi:regulator of sirC expression with transglutaminase-like and TPR domain
MSGALTKADRVRVLAEFLGRDTRLRGNDGDYYSIDNSLLPRVLESRLGIPISLTLVYMLVARRAGFQVDGVGLPGHFLARHEDIFFDPFHGGRRIGLEECAALMEQQNLVLTPAHLQPTTPRQMLIRMLTNIYFIAEQGVPPLAAKISEWMDLLRKS